MENSELQEVWRAIDTEINRKSMEELSLLLASKSRQTINKFLVISGISIVVCVGLLVFLTITSLNRQNDLIYLLNNATLGLVTLTALLSGLWAWYKLQSNRYNQPLKSWLEERINLLSKWLTGRLSKLYLILIPVLYILTVLSIHVYFENKSFVEVLHTEESIIGLIVAAPIGLFVAFFGVRKIRKYELSKLEFLKDLYGRLCSGC